MPKVSVIISTYNRAHYLYQALESVLNQTFPDFEVIVVDDGSTDNTREVLEAYRNSIRYIHQENRGRSEARNSGIRAASGKYIAFLDDDDVWLPSKLEQQVAFLEANPHIGLVHTLTKVIDGEGHVLQAETKTRFKFYEKAIKIGYTYEGMSQLCIMFYSSIMVRSECLQKVELFDPMTETFEDWDFYLRFALQYGIGTITDPLVRYRLHGVQSTTTQFTRGRIQTSIKHLALLNTHHDLPFRDKARHNFYKHLANAYYISLNTEECRYYVLEALKLNPLALFRSRLGAHLLMTIMPTNLIQKIRRLKGLRIEQIKSLSRANNS